MALSSLGWYFPGCIALAQQSIWPTRDLWSCSIHSYLVQDQRVSLHLNCAFSWYVSCQEIKWIAFQVTILWSNLLQEDVQVYTRINVMVLAVSQWNLTLYLSSCLFGYIHEHRIKYNILHPVIIFTCTIQRPCFYKVAFCLRNRCFITPNSGKNLCNLALRVKLRCILIFVFAATCTFLYWIKILVQVTWLKNPEL